MPKPLQLFWGGGGDKTFHTGMYVCVRGGPNQPLHRDPQWSIVLPLSLVIPLVVPHYEYSAGFYTWGRRNSHLVP
jgi:hypothetical protein